MKGPSAHDRTGPATNPPPGQVCAMTVYLRTGAGRHQACTLEGGP